MLQYLIEQLRNAGMGSKVIAGLVLVAVVAIAATAAVVARKPHFELLYSELTASESAKVQRALSEAGIPFEQSQPPGPFNVYVDESSRYKAMHAVAGAGALDRPEGGIVTGDGGLSTVFMSQSERQQVTLKRQWQEMEKLLEELDFVVKASVTTTSGARFHFGENEPKTGSVMLQLRRPEMLSVAQGKTVANLVRFGLGIEPRHLNIADQLGNSLFDGTTLDETGTGASDWMEQKRLFERDLEERSNRILAEVLGPSKARVSVSSSWNHDLNTTISQSSDPTSKVVLSETTATTKTPQGSGSKVGGPAGAGSSSGAFGVDTAGVPREPAPAGDQVAKTENTSKEYWTPQETVRTVRLAPKLERLSISLFLDESLAGQETQLADNVKAAVGFDDTRTDVFSTVILPLYVPPVDESAGDPVEEPSTLSPLVETLLKRGVEIVSALVFLILLAKALKGAKTEPAKTDANADAVDNDEMMERLAQAQVEELVRSDPERVGEILSSWAKEETTAAL